MAAKQELRFDNGKLATMKEPLMVRVEKLKGSMRQPIEIPAKAPNMPPGTGLSRDEIMRLESWLVNEWTGGGFYECTVTDQDNVSMSWTFSYPPTQYPEKPPPNLQGAAAPVPAPVIPIQPSMIQQPMGSSYTGTGFPTRDQFAQPAPPPQPPLPGWAFPQAPQSPPAWQGWPGQGWGGGFGGFGMPPRGFAGFGVEDRSRNEEDRTRMLEQQLANEREERRRSEEKAERERAEQRHQQEMETLRLQIAKMADQGKESEEARRLRESLEASQRSNTEMLAKLAESMKPKDEDRGLREIEAKLAAEREERRRAEEKAERERDRERADRERERLEAQAERERDRQQRAMEQMQLQTQQQMQQMQLQMQQAQNASSPLIEFFKENSRQQAEMARERERNQSGIITQLQPYMINPKEIATMMKDAGRSTDELLRTVTGSFGGILETYKNAFESVANITQGGGPSPALGMLQEGIAKASEIAGEYLKAKRDASVQEARAKTEVARAHAQVAQAQAQAQAYAHQQTGQAGGGLNGVAAPNGTPAQPVQATVVASAPSGAKPTRPVRDPNLGVPEAAPSPNAQKTQGDMGVPEQGPPPKANKPTDADLLGIVYGEVQKLRASAEAGAAPQLVVEDVMKGIGFVVQAMESGGKLPDGTPIVIPPVFQLFQDGRYADVWDILLPKMPQTYRDECVQIMALVMEGNDGAEDEEDDAEEDGGEAEERFHPEEN